jgi:ketosteroid isomerase-like protein
MKTLPLVFAGAVAACARPAPAVPSDDADFAAVRAVMDRMAVAIRAQDTTRMFANYSADRVSFAAHGVLATRRAELGPLYAGWDSTAVKGTYVAWTDPTFERLGPDAVLVFSKIRLARGNPAGQPTDTTGGTWTGVFAREAGEWLIRHEHESFERR